MKNPDISSYPIERIVGEGSFAKVYKALGQELAIKYVAVNDVPVEYRNEIRRQFRSEWRFAKFHVPGTVPILEYVENDSTLYLVMQYCEGSGICVKELCMAEKYKLLSGAMRIISEVHKHRIVHLDIKPDNFLLGQGGNILLCDFSHSKRRTFCNSVKFLIKKPKYGVGTLAYMSPEQMKPRRGSANIDYRSDIYSFGVMAYQLLTDRLPFGEIIDDDSAIESYISNVLSSKWNKDILYDLEIDPKWIKVISLCLSLSIGDRPKSFQKLIDYLN